ncbi:Peptide methionine sulfoxide reductase MsrA/MsrB [Streptococcus constellatus]|uniref:Peptide methionine sulfoxide reductase MsrA/MsrB n=1 Tax=Streptococcus constellatus TaxID=76860 RepID=A0A564SH25_STRCV|nr:redoxin family protein [Streptococcus constellatus]VUW94447.1 Peptide methionine sulfoxide reductase MsrA/MsrB [Streptococcus constellatus]VUX10322.1 Peptide methionine sulfoxide reductase MsrA/MsrB [Streptococcus gordonii]
MKKSMLVVTSLLCATFLGACANQKTSSSANNTSKTEQGQVTTKDNKVIATKANQGEAVPDFSLKGVDGKTYKLSDFKGKKVYLKFWASWCSICLSTLKHTDELAKENGKDYVILSVVSPGHKGEKSEADFKKWYSKLDYKNLPVLIDSSGKLLEQYGVRSYPTAAFIDSNGKLVKTRPGFIKKSEIESTLKSIK